MHDKEMRKKILDEVVSFLDDRESSKLQSGNKPTMEVDFKEVSAPMGDTDGAGATGLGEGTPETGNAEMSKQDPGVFRGEQSGEPDEDPDKQADELADNGYGLGEHEKNDLEKAYAGIESSEGEDETDEPKKG